ncbi:phosphate/phosphite/phosphonate ABC transporter substrate-binding protein [Amycolatopsis sp. GA6-003]|uniref:phosphate/phosphite/phosphonate ABC transporter substrate-binding protein n=1 Tax=Amycolatopsis sp. GA6-003 TaxID=2652444 RepID=UPI0039175A5B
MTGLRSSRLLGSALLAAALLTSSGCGTARAPGPAGVPDPLRIGLSPSILPALQRETYQPLAQYLHQRLGVEVVFSAPVDEPAALRALRDDAVDVARLDALTYAGTDPQDSLAPLVTEVDAETGNPRYLSALVVRHGSGVRSVADVVRAGARIALGGPHSAAGDLYPRAMLRDAGAACPGPPPQQCVAAAATLVTGTGYNTARAVLDGTAGAGGLALRTLHRLERDRAVPAGAFDVLRTHLVPGSPWVARRGLGAAAQNAIAAAFESISAPSLLNLLQAHGYVPAHPADYRELRADAERLGTGEATP